jgi:hypothetical protein
VAGYCERCNEISASIKCGGYLDQVIKVGYQGLCVLQLISERLIIPFNKR